MSDLRLLAFVLSGGFLFLGGIWLAETTVLLYCCLAWSFCWFLLFLACISLTRWLVPPSQSSHE